MNNLKQFVEEILLEPYRVSSSPLIWKVTKEGRDRMVRLLRETIRRNIVANNQRLDDLYLFAILDNLSPRERQVLKARFLEKRSLEEVTKQLGVTRERIRQLEAKALENIRQQKDE